MREEHDTVLSVLNNVPLHNEECFSLTADYWKQMQCVCSHSDETPSVVLSSSLGNILFGCVQCSAAVEHLFALGKMLWNSHWPWVSTRAGCLTVKGCELVCSAFAFPERECVIL